MAGAQKVFCVNDALLSGAFASDPAAFDAMMKRYGDYLATNKRPIATICVPTARSNINKLVVTASDSGVNLTVVFQCFFDAFDDVACVKLVCAQA